MGTYDSQVALALRLIREKGGPATYVEMQPQSGANPWDPVDSVPVEHTVDAVFLNLNLQTSGETFWNGTQVMQGDKKVLMAGAALAARVNINGEIHRVVDGVTEKWKIINNKLLDPNGQRILYTLQVRQ